MSTTLLDNEIILSDKEIKLLIEIVNNKKKANKWKTLNDSRLKEIANDFLKLSLTISGLDVNLRDIINTKKFREILRAAYNNNKNKIVINRQQQLVIAIEKGQVTIVKQLLSVPGIDINETDSSQRTPLLEACENGHIAIVKLLLAVPGIDVNREEHWSVTPLSAACQSGYTKIVKQLLTMPGIDVNKVDNIDGATPLLHAYNIDNDNIVKQLLAVPSIDVNKLDKHGNTILRHACRRSDMPFVEQLLAAPGIDVNKMGKRGGTPLATACHLGHTDIVKKLLTAPGIDVNKRNYHGGAPLLFACKNNNANIVTLLLSKPEIDVNISELAAIGDTDPNFLSEEQRKNGDTPLIVSCNNGYLNIVKLLLAVPGIDVNKNEERNEHRTPLLAACHKKSTSIVEQLLAAPGIDVNKEDYAGGKPLVYACQNAIEDIVKLLLAAPGIDVSSNSLILLTCRNDFGGFTSERADITRQLLEFVRCISSHQINKELSSSLIESYINGHQLPSGTQLVSVKNKLDLEVFTHPEIDWAFPDKTFQLNTTDTILMSDKIDCPARCLPCKHPFEVSTLMRWFKEKIYDEYNPNRTDLHTNCPNCGLRVTHIELMSKIQVDRWNVMSANEQVNEDELKDLRPKFVQYSSTVIDLINEENKLTKQFQKEKDQVVDVNNEIRKLRDLKDKILEANAKTSKSLKKVKANVNKIPEKARNYKELQKRYKKAEKAVSKNKFTNRFKQFVT